MKKAHFQRPLYSGLEDAEVKDSHLCHKNSAGESSSRNNLPTYREYRILEEWKCGKRGFRKEAYY